MEGASMPISRATLRALERLSGAKRTRVESMLDVEPRMSEYLNAHGVNRLAETPYPVAMMEPKDFLSLAVAYDPENRYKPVPHGSDVAENIKASGLGVPKGEDIGLAIDEYSRKAMDFGGMPMLEYAPGYKGDNIGILGHEGRGRAAYFDTLDSLMPVQMGERNFFHDYHEINDSVINRIAKRLKYPADLRESMRLDHEDYVPMIFGPKPKSRRDALDFLKQKLTVSPEDYFLRGKPVKEYNWQDMHYGLFDQGGSVNAY
jgi:hypothetical protein